MRKPYVFADPGRRADVRGLSSPSELNFAAMVHHYAYTWVMLYAT